MCSIHPQYTITLPPVGCHRCSHARMNAMIAAPPSSFSIGCTRYGMLHRVVCGLRNRWTTSTGNRNCCNNRRSSVVGNVAVNNTTGHPTVINSLLKNPNPQKWFLTFGK
jgi:hypothetical protein